MITNRNLLIVGYFALGLFGGWLLASAMNDGPQHVEPEYFIELRPDGSAIIEGLDRHTYTCPTIEDIPNVLLKDNL